MSSHEKILKELALKQWTLAVAESCTGGWIGKSITEIPGSSSVFWGGFITYHNQAKEQLLGVLPQTLEKYGAVSKETLKEMLAGVLDRTPADIALAVTGIAGPGGGSFDKPVGTVWSGLMTKSGTEHCVMNLFTGDREEIRRQTVDFIFKMLKEYLDGLTT